MRYFYLIAVFILGVLGVSANRADAAILEVCNETSYVMQFGIAARYSASTQSQGWEYALPGTCTKINDDAPPDSLTYIYARPDIRSYAGDGIVISGNEPFCIASPYKAFRIKGTENCQGQGYDEVDFAFVTGKVIFSESENYDHKRSLVAARQRLLDVLEYTPGPVDGYGGRRTRSATISYRRAHNLSSNITDDELIRHLHQSAVKSYKKRGLTLCNKTKNAVWSTTGEPYNNSYRSSGWLYIAKGECTKAISTPLTKRYYYVYAEAVADNATPILIDSKPKIWSGDFGLCTKPTRFVIDNQENCEARGFNHHRFIRIDTGNRHDWTYNLK